MSPASFRFSLFEFGENERNGIANAGGVDVAANIREGEESTTKSPEEGIDVVSGVEFTPRLNKLKTGRRVGGAEFSYLWLSVAVLGDGSHYEYRHFQ